MPGLNFGNMPGSMAPSGGMKKSPFGAAPSPTPSAGISGAPGGGSYIDDIMGADISGEEPLGAPSPGGNPLADKWDILSPEQQSRIQQIINEKPAAPGAAPMGGAPALGAPPAPGGMPGASPIQPLKR